MNSDLRGTSNVGFQPSKSKEVRIFNCSVQKTKRRKWIGSARKCKEVRTTFRATGIRKPRKIVEENAKKSLLRHGGRGADGRLPDRGFVQPRSQALANFLEDCESFQATANCLFFFFFANCLWDDLRSQRVPTYFGAKMVSEAVSETSSQLNIVL